MSKLTKNIIFNLVGQVLIVGLGLFATRDVFRQLGDDALGILFFAIAINAVLTPVIDLGISATVVREVARHLNSDREYLIQLMRTSTLFYWCSYLLLGALFWMVAPWLVSHWLTLKTLNAAIATRALQVLALGLFLMLPRSLYSNLLRGVERMEFNNIIDVGTTALQQAGTIVILMHGHGLVEISYWYLVTYFLSILAYARVCLRFLPGRALVPGFSMHVVRKNATFTSRVSAYTVLAAIQMESDKAVMSKLVPVGLLGFYGVAQTMVARVSRITVAVTQAAFPTLSALFHSSDRLGLRREYRRLQDLVCYGLVPCYAAVVFASRPLFSYLLSTQAAQALLLPTALLCLGWYMNGTLNIPAIVALAVGRADIGAMQNFYALFLITPLTVVLIWKWKLIGAGLAFVAYHIFAYSYGARRTASECLDIRPVEWYVHVLKIMALAAITYGTAWFILQSTNQNTIPALALAYLAATAAYLYATYLAVGMELRRGFMRLRGRALGSEVPRFTSSD